MSNTKILIAVTDGESFEKVGWRTGLWFSELTHFWDVAEAAGYSMDIASPCGGRVPIDPESLVLSEMATAFGLEGAVSEHYRDRRYMDLLKNTLKIADVQAIEYASIYLAGGHGALSDFADSSDLAKLVADFYEAAKVLSAVCHGPSGLLNVRQGLGSVPEPRRRGRPTDHGPEPWQRTRSGRSRDSTTHGHR